jgi:Domain of unknown function (DUF1707)
VVSGPWDPSRAGAPDRFLASDADRERVVDALKTAFVQGVLTKDELDVQAGHALRARTYGQLATLTAHLNPQPRKAQAAKLEPAKLEPGKPQPRTPAGSTIPAPARRRATKKVVVATACAIVLPAALAATFLSYYGGFLVMMLFTFVVVVVMSGPPTTHKSGPAPMSSRR